ncbi:MAG: hypothetical protein KGL18_07475 [Burkholderiales bacterium]|nr:hypothetical protein [Burkholderiales bacterium]MDE1926074.1 hypothetical protein [Burkholderiales bacterium]MDE2158172.1 hypothetical protein [Burkholderiales bacterium]MDE2502799.1 hypothetical protein [Burkholderiales bacterium]
MKVSASDQAIVLVEGRLRAEVSLARIRRIVVLCREIMASVAEPDLGWVLETTEADWFLPGDCALEGLLRGPLQQWLDESRCLYLATYVSAPLRLRALQAQWALLRRRACALPPGTSATLLAQADVEGPLSLEAAMHKVLG